MANKTDSSPLPKDWPPILVLLVKQRAIEYAAELDKEWSVPERLRERFTMDLSREIDQTFQDEADASFIDRLDNGLLEDEISASLKYYATKIRRSIGL